MKRFISALIVCAMILSMVPAVFAEDSTATITFDNTAKRTELSTSKQVWEENGITVTNEKGSSTSNVADYSNPARFYKSSTLIIAYPGMQVITVNCNSSSYASALKNSITDKTVTVTAKDTEKTVTIALPEAMDSYTIVLSGGQVRVDSITVSAAAAEAHTHNSDAYDYDTENHWTVCTCGDESTKGTAEAHDYTASAYKCSVCGFINEPAADSTLTIAEAIALGEAIGENNVSTKSKYYVTGTVTEITNTQYGNLYITDGTNSLYIYGTYSEDGNTRFDAMEVPPAVGDLVTYYGVIGYYNGAQMKNGWVVPTPAEPEEEEKTTLDVGDNSITLDAGDLDGKTWTYTATEDGNVSITVTYLAMPEFAEEGEPVMTPVDAAFIDMVLGMQFQLTMTKNGEAVEGTSVNVVAGDVIAVTLASNMGTATEATLTLTLGETVVVVPDEPGTSAENPIVIDSLPYEVPVDGIHDLYFAYTATEDCTLLITYPAGGLVSVENWEEGPEENTKVVEVAAGSTAIINLWSNSAVTGTYTIALYVEEEPEGPISGSGTSSDPYAVTVPGTYEVAIPSNSWGYVYYSYTATESGKLTFTMDCENWSSFRIANNISGASYTVYKSGGVYTYTIELYKGDTASGSIYTSTTNGETTSKFTMSFEACEVDKTVSINAGSYYLPADVIVDGNSRVNCQISFSTTGAKLYVVGSSTNYYVMINEVKYEPDENGKVVLPLEPSYSKQTVYLYNTGDEPVTCTYNLSYNLGTSQNPDTITEMGDYTADVPEGYAGYNYIWTAPESGKLTFTILEESNWSYSIENTTTGVSYYYPCWNATWTEQIYEPTVTLEVNEGDEVKLQIQHEDYSAGAMKFNLSFVAGAVEQFQNMYASSDTQEVTDEVAPGASIRYDVTSYLSGGQLTITGTNFYVVVGGTGVYNEELGVFLPEGGTRVDPVDGVAYLNLVDYETTTIHIVNTGSEAATFTFGTNYPTGTQANPDTITDSETITLPENANAYYYTYTATGDGYIIVTITSDGGVYHNVYNPASYLYAGEAFVADASEGTKVSLPVYADDQIVISVNTWDVDDSVPGGEITISVTFVPATVAGSIGCSWNGTINENETFEIPANSSAVYVLDGFNDCCATITGENFYILVNGEKLEPVDGVVTLPLGTYMIEVVNTSDEANTFTAGVIYPTGSQANPEILTMGDHSATVSLYGYYWYTFTATEAGTLKLDMTCTDWYVVDYNTYAEFSSEGSEDPYFEVAEGDVLALRVSTVMGAAGTITFTASFTPAGEGGDDGEKEYLESEEWLDLGDNYIESAENETGEWYYYAAETGILTISVSDLLCYIEDEGWVDLSMNALNTGSVSIYVNDEKVAYSLDTENAVLTVEVTAGDIVYVTMSSATGVGLRTSLNLAFESNVHDASDGILILGNNSFTLSTEDSGKWTYTATENGTLVIELLSASILMYDDFGDMVTTPLQPAELLALMDGYVALTVNGEAFVVDYTASNLYLATLNLKSGDEVVLEFTNNFWVDVNMVINLSMTEEEAGPDIIDELPAELVAIFEDADTAFVDGMSWQYTAAQDGVINFVGLTEGAEIWVSINGDASVPVDGSIEVKAGDVLIITLYGEDAGTYSCMMLYAEEETVAYGDVNGDGVITEEDARLVAQYYVGMEVEIDETAADVDGNGIINHVDAMLIAQMINADSETTDETTEDGAN